MTTDFYVCISMMKLSWSKRMVRKLFNIKCKPEDFQADEMVCAGGSLDSFNGAKIFSGYLSFLLSTKWFYQVWSISLGLSKKKNLLLVCLLLTMFMDFRLSPENMSIPIVYTTLKFPTTRTWETSELFCACLNPKNCFLLA